jgi:hypothetical protein
VVWDEEDEEEEENEEDVRRDVVLASFPAPLWIVEGEKRRRDEISESEVKQTFHCRSKTQTYTLSYHSAPNPHKVRNEENTLPRS